MSGRRLVFAGGLIVVLAFVAGCSLDSGNPMATTAGDSDGVVAPDKTADHPQSVSSSQAPARVLAKKVATTEESEESKESKDKGGPKLKSKEGPARYALRPR